MLRLGQMGKDRNEARRGLMVSKKIVGGRGVFGGDVPV